MASARSVSLMFVCVFVVGVMSTHSRLDSFGHTAFRYYVPLVEDVYQSELAAKASTFPAEVAGQKTFDQDYTALASTAIGVGVGVGIVACSVFAGIAYAVFQQYRDVEQFDWEGDDEFSKNSAEMKLIEDDILSADGEKEDLNEEDYDAWTSIRQVDSDEEESEDDEESTAGDNDDTDALSPCSSNSQIIVQSSSMRKANSFGG